MATKRHANFPTVWLMTDERLGGRNAGDPLWRAIRNLPRGAGIVLRHHGWLPAERRSLCRRIAAVARRQGLILVASGMPGPDGVHIPAFARGRRDRKRAGKGITTASAHDLPEVRSAVRAGADLVFLSPVFATGSHPGATALGPLRFGKIARHSPVPVVALGGMTPARQRRLAPLGAAGYAAIDWWISAGGAGSARTDAAARPDGRAGASAPDRRQGSDRRNRGSPG